MNFSGLRTSSKISYIHLDLSLMSPKIHVITNGVVYVVTINSAVCKVTLKKYLQELVRWSRIPFTLGKLLICMQLLVTQRHVSES